METVETRIVPKAPYDFAINLCYLQTSPSAILEQVDAFTYARVWTIHSLDVRVEVSADESSQALRITLTASRLTPDAVAAAMEQVRRVFQLDTDPIGFYTACATDPVLAGFIRQHPGLRPVLYDEAERRLTAFRGIGRWTAEYVLMRGLGFPDVIPAADVGLQTVIGRAYGLGRKATEAEVRHLAERWAPWRSWAAYVWWYRLQTDL